MSNYNLYNVEIRCQGLFAFNCGGSDGIGIKRVAPPELGFYFFISFSQGCSLG
jgi:hypothetical protein